MSIIESRNKREGWYRGWAQGFHIRSHEHKRVDSWRAFRLTSERRKFDR